jgi:hypothetical protein
MSVKIIIVFLIGFGVLWAVTRVHEGFAYRKNPCGEFKGCSDCAGAAGCGWCKDLLQCQPMAQDGFPIRTADSSTGLDVRDSPYLEEMRKKTDVILTAPASRIHICNPYGFVTEPDKC